MLVNARARTSQEKSKVVNASLQTQQWCYSWASTARANYNRNTMFTGKKRMTSPPTAISIPRHPHPALKLWELPLQFFTRFLSSVCLFVFPHQHVRVERKKWPWRQKLRLYKTYLFRLQPVATFRESAPSPLFSFSYLPAVGTIISINRLATFTCRRLHHPTLSQYKCFCSLKILGMRNTRQTP